jgi:Zn finger protein HypA/HybF involved in hydrogenase expression
MSDSWKNLSDLIPPQATAYVVCPDCRHPYTEALRCRPGPCPSCKSTTNQGQYDALAVGDARAPELDPDKVGR